MTDLYRMTWQRENDDNALVITGPILWHRKTNPHWAKENAPYTHAEALSACRRWNRVCPTHNHKIIAASKGGS
jgi:hypothetical protein